ncbi:MAG: hypothetical protein ACKVT2_21985 [Saprospiraceae bacterium]
MGIKSVTTWTGANGAYVMVSSGFAFGLGTFDLLKFNPANNQFEELQIGGAEPGNLIWWNISPNRAFPSASGVVFNNVYSFYDPEMPDKGPILTKFGLDWDNSLTDCYCLYFVDKFHLFFEKDDELLVCKEK